MGAKAPPGRPWGQGGTHRSSAPPQRSGEQESVDSGPPGSLDAAHFPIHAPSPHEYTERPTRGLLYHALWGRRTICGGPSDATGPHRLQRAQTVNSSFYGRWASPGKSGASSKTAEHADASPEQRAIRRRPRPRTARAMAHNKDLPQSSSHDIARTQGARSE